MRAADVKEVDLRIHRHIRATIRTYRVKFCDRELKQQTRPEAAQRLGDHDPETVQQRPIRKNRFRTDPLASNPHLERLDKKLVGDMHSCSLLRSGWQAQCPSCREPTPPARRPGYIRTRRHDQGINRAGAAPLPLDRIREQAWPDCLTRALG